jgi:1,4-dihydroxy-2-naphthoate octaprenyltransferase
MDLSNYVSAELSILVPVLYAIGIFIKNSSIKDWKIPFILGAMGIVLTFAYLVSKQWPADGGEWFGLIFSSITQGILEAASSVYANNLYKQYIKRNESSAE